MLKGYSESPTMIVGLFKRGFLRLKYRLEFETVDFLVTLSNIQEVGRMVYGK